MTILAETIFEIGHSHEVCEDYADHGEDWTILADGCSNGNGPNIDTDWGSRILCKAGAQHLPKVPNELTAELMDVYLTAVGVTAQTQVQVFHQLPVEALTATLLGQRLLPESVESFAIGDGIIGGKRHDGRWKLHVIDFKKGGTSGKGAPFYLKYKFCDEVEKYVNLFGGVYEVTTYFGVLDKPDMEYPADPPTDTDGWEAFQLERQQKWAQVMTESVKEYNVIDSPYFMTHFPRDEYEFTFNCSDGGETFRWFRKSGTSRTKEIIHVLDALRIFYGGIKNFSPRFLRRAANWQFKEDRKGTFSRRGWFHEDDFSTGALYLGKPE
jgi:hypothetical protein